MMFSPISILVTTVIVALLISLLVMLRISMKVADNNTQLVNRVTSLEQSVAPSLTDRHITREKTEAADSVKAVVDMDDNELYRWFDSQIEEQQLFCQPDIDLKTVAQTLGLTQRRILQMLKGNPNSLTFSEYITRKRLAYSCRLLVEQPNWNIDTVAREAGIVSDATFRRLFRRHYDMKPSEYRERYRKH